MHLFVRSISGHYLALETDSQASISSLSHQIALKEGIPTSHQRLIYCGKQLAPDLTVSDYGIPCEGTIDLSLRLYGGMKVTIHPMWDEDFEADLNDDMPISELKTLISSKVNFPPTQLRVEYEGNVLSDEMTVGVCGLREGGVFRVTLLNMPHCTTRQ